MRKYHAQPKFANDTTKQCIDEYTNNNSNLGGKTDERPYLSPSPTFYDETPFITKIDKGSGGVEGRTYGGCSQRKRQSVGN